MRIQLTKGCPLLRRNSPQEQRIDAYVADRNCRRRDPAFADADRYKERSRADKRRFAGRTEHTFTPHDFEFDEKNRTCRCPAGQSLYCNGNHVVIDGLTGVKFKGAKSVCGPCALRAQCLRYPDRTPSRQVVFFTGRAKQRKERPIDIMKRKFDTLMGRFIYNKRIAIVEPVFANLRNKGMDRFTLRGRHKVDAQWKMFNLVHNIEKIANYGTA